jgi:hypothetical protein
VDDLGVGRRRARQRPEPALAVGERCPGEQPQGPREHDVADPAAHQHAVDAPGEAAADHVVGRAVEDRRRHGGELLGRVLAVGVAERDHGRAVVDDGPAEALAHGGAEAPVDGQRHHDGAGRRRLGRGGVARRVVDDQHPHGPSGDRGRRPAHDVGHRGRLVARRQHEHHGPDGHRLAPDRGRAEVRFA